jgi:hypothetical protein
MNKFWKSKSFLVRYDRLVVYYGKLSVEFYWPQFCKSKTEPGVFMPTQLNFKRAEEDNRWMYKWAGVIKVLGFGFGLCWDHCENPNKGS